MEKIKIIDPKICKEIYIILNKLNFLDKLPSEIEEYIIENQDLTYKFDFNIDIPLIYQVDSEETKICLSYIYLKYICNNEIEKNILLKKYKENEKKYQERQRKKYNPNNIFKNKQKDAKENKTNANQMISYKKSFWQKIVDIIKRIT